MWVQMVGVRVGVFVILLALSHGFFFFLINYALNSFFFFLIFKKCILCLVFVAVWAVL